MDVAKIDVTEEAARSALLEYKAHRNTYDKRDWEIEAIYRAISRGKTVISVQDAIRNAGVDEQNRPRLAISIADAAWCRCRWECIRGDDYRLIFRRHEEGSRRDRPPTMQVPWNDYPYHRWWQLEAKVPRIPPQYRPVGAALGNYHILWEADWQEIPRDPYLLRRIGKDAWIIVAAWELTDVEMNVLRAHRAQ